MEAILAAITSQSGIAVLVLMAVNITLVTVLRELHKAIREDRKEASIASDRLAQVITDLRLQLARRE